MTTRNPDSEVIFTDDESAIEFLTRDGNLRVPCSRYGNDTEDCAPVALALAQIAQNANGDDITEENLDYYMGLVVNDHDDVLSLIREHGTQEHRDLLDEDLLTETIWELLEHDAPQGCESVQDLYSWSLNYDAGKGPMTLFLDLIGWSEDELGEVLYDLSSASLGYLELSKLADALNSYSDHPQDVRDYVNTLMTAESRE